MKEPLDKITEKVGITADQSQIAAATTFEWVRRTVPAAAARFTLRSLLSSPVQTRLTRQDPDTNRSQLVSAKPVRQRRVRHTKTSSNLRPRPSRCLDPLDRFTPKLGRCRVRPIPGHASCEGISNRRTPHALMGSGYLAGAN